MKRFIPKFIFQAYHFTVAVLAAAFCRFPSEKMIVIGVTGTNGKSTVANLIAAVLEGAGFKVGLASTVNFKVGGEEWMNETKMTMLGRFGLQKLLRRMADVGCRYAVVETSSEGIAQFRHVGINYDVAVFTNLTPEHIERHGSFEIYQRMKGKLFRALAKGKRKFLFGREVKKTSVVNLDDEYAEHFLQFPAEEKWGYGVSDQRSAIGDQQLTVIEAEDVGFNIGGTTFNIRHSTFNIQLLGEFNVYNALAAISVGLSQGIDLEAMAAALANFSGVAGRLEKLDEGQDFSVFVDYAHNPGALLKTYRTISKFQGKDASVIGVLGAAGGGRDKWKRPEMGKLAAEYCDHVIITNEDPYDENPAKIIEEISVGAQSYAPQTAADAKRPWICKILDRKEAIAKALSLAKPGDIVIITGKGCEKCIMGSKGSRIPWNEREAVRGLLREMSR